MQLRQLRPVTPAACFHGFILWFRAGVACAGFQRSAEQETETAASFTLTETLLKRHQINSMEINMVLLFEKHCAIKHT